MCRLFKSGPSLPTLGIPSTPPPFDHHQCIMCQRSDSCTFSQTVSGPVTGATHTHTQRTPVLSVKVNSTFHQPDAFTAER